MTTPLLTAAEARKLACPEITEDQIQKEVEIALRRIKSAAENYRRSIMLEGGIWSAMAPYPIEARNRGIAILTSPPLSYQARILFGNTPSIVLVEW